MTTKYFNKDGVEFKEGDSVKVLRTAADHDPDGMGVGVEWMNCWVDSMDSSIGKTFTIRDVGDSGVNFTGSIMSYPISVLENLSAKPVVRPAIAGNIEVGDTVRVLNALGCAAYKPYVGKELVVREVDERKYGEYIVRCTGEGLSGKHNGQFNNRFELVEKAKTKFGLDNLKEGMRVVTANGRNGVIYFDDAGVALIAYVNAEGISYNYDKAHFETDTKRSYFAIVKVYARPDRHAIMQLLKKGELLWSKNTDAIDKADAKVADAQEAVAIAQKTVDTANTALRAANNDLTIAEVMAADARK